MDYEHIIYTPGKVARIVLNRPEYLNAQGVKMRDEMDHAFVQAAEDKSVGAIVLSGAGKSFSAGHDIGTAEDTAYRKEIDRTRSNRFDAFDDMRKLCVENTLRWRNIPKPTIAMVHGYCIFGGWMFAAAMDVVFAAEDTMFLPGNVQYFSSPWDIGPKKTKEILFEHRFMTAWEAHEEGFANRVFPAETLEEETLSYANRVADNYLNNPLWVRMIKFSTNHMMDAQGFTAEIETAYNNFCTMQGLQSREVDHPRDGGFARTTVAKKNLKASMPWLESKQKRR
ncbi:MAG: enoyl-CoA hydratase-related protein [Desulfobacterales bacterium]